MGKLRDLRTDEYLKYHDIDAVSFFWRTNQQQEIDLIEQAGEQLAAYEFKWSAKGAIRFPQTFTDNYPGSKTFVISPHNVEDFLLK